MAIYKNTPPIVTNGLVLYLDAANPQSYMSGSTLWRDISGNNNSGSLINGPTFNSDGGGSILFDGVNDYVESTPIQPTFFTLSCWFRATGVPSTNDTSGGVLIASNPQLISSAVQYFLSYSWLNQRIVGLVQSGASTIVTPNNSVLRNQIYNIVLTYNGSNISIYINGTLSVLNAYSTTPIYPTTGNINTQIGRWGYPGFTRHFNGNIYNTSIYNRALSQSEITQNYNATKARFGL